MVVHTDTELVREMRTTLLELILSDHPRQCLTCHKTRHLQPAGPGL